MKWKSGEEDRSHNAEPRWFNPSEPLKTQHAVETVGREMCPNFQKGKDDEDEYPLQEKDTVITTVIYVAFRQRACYSHVPGVQKHRSRVVNLFPLGQHYRVHRPGGLGGHSLRRYKVVDKFPVKGQSDG